MYCQHCGNQIANGSAFCSQCGNKQGGFAPPPPPPPAPINDLNSTNQSKSSNKEGDIKKCPSCGTVAPSFGTVCSTCGHEFRNVETNASMEKLFDLLQRASSISEKSSIIINFPVPNTKESILEFLAQGISILQADDKSADKSTAEKLARKTFRVGLGVVTWGMSEVVRGASGAFKSLTKNEIEKLAPAWRTKCEQVILKARFAMKDDPKTLEEVEFYAKKIGV
jgi:hypothetical protein